MAQSNSDFDFSRPTNIPIPGKMLNLHIPDLQSLYNCYIPFFEHGGLFVTTEDKFSLGDEVLLALSLGNSQDKKFLRTNVGWVNFARSTPVRPRGIGVAFGKDEICISVKNLIEKQLGTSLKSDRPIFTM